MAEESDYQRRAREALEKGEDLPDFPMTSMEGESAQVNEMFINFLKAGFTADQAIYLTASVITDNPGIAPKGMNGSD